MLSALLTISAAYMITWLLQVIGWPYLVWALGSRLRDRGWSLARLLTWLAVSLIIWSLAYFKLPLNTVWAIWLVLFILAVGAVSLTLRCRSQIKQVFQEAKWLLLVAESLFLFGFFFLSLVRGFNPAILDNSFNDERPP